MEYCKQNNLWFIKLFFIIILINDLEEYDNKLRVNFPNIKKTKLILFKKLKN